VIPALLFAVAAPASAQRIDVWLDAAAAHTRPPGGVQDVEAETYGILGARVGVEGHRGLLEFAAQGGRTAQAEGGAWLSGALCGQAGGRIARLYVSGRGELFRLHYDEPFSYAASAVTVQPQAALPVGRWWLVARGELTRGGWRAGAQGPPLPPGVGDPPEPATGPLAVTGGALEAVHGRGRSAVRLAVEAYDSGAGGALDGAYGGIVGSVSHGTGNVAAVLEARAWRTPAGGEFGYHAAVTVAVRPDIELRIMVGRTVRDPLYGVPGSVTASAGASWRIGRFTPWQPLRIVEVGERVPGGRRVTFRLRAPEARSVALSGDFTGWEPRPMRRGEGGTWVLALVLEPGLHHFGFLVDGSVWTVPEGAPGVADDGWGRKNASVVVEE
jgi:hypothetical protein